MSTKTKNLFLAAAKLWIKVRKDLLSLLHEQTYGEKLKSVTVYEEIAKHSGFKDWNTLWGILEKECADQEYSKKLDQLLLKIENGFFAYKQSLDKAQGYDETDDGWYEDEDGNRCTVAGKYSEEDMKASYFCSQLYSEIADRLSEAEEEWEQTATFEIPPDMADILFDITLADRTRFAQSEYDENIFPVGDQWGLHFSMCYFSILFRKPLNYLLCVEEVKELDRREQANMMRRRAAHEAKKAAGIENDPNDPYFKKFLNGEISVEEIPIDPEYDPIVKFKLGTLVETIFEGKKVQGFINKYRQEGSVWALFNTGIEQDGQKIPMQLGPYSAETGMAFLGMNEDIPIILKAPRPLKPEVEEWDSTEGMGGDGMAEFMAAAGLPGLGRVWELKNTLELWDYLIQPRN